MNLTACNTQIQKIILDITISNQKQMFKPINTLIGKIYSAAKNANAFCKFNQNYLLEN